MPAPSRPFLAASLVLAALAIPANATPVSCKLIVDATKDEGPDKNVPHLVDRPEGDLVSADLATSAKSITFVVRVRAMPAETPGIGSGSLMFVRIGEAEFLVDMKHGYDGTVAGIGAYKRLPGNGFSSTPIAKTTLVVDRAHAELRSTYPLSVFAPYVHIKRGSTIRLELVDTEIAYGSMQPGPSVAGQRVPNGADEGWDSSDAGPQLYRAGAKSCVRVGA